jgi:hypothetical protein
VRLKPRLSPPFFAAVVVPSPWMMLESKRTVLMTFEHRALENGIKASVRFTPPKGDIDARVVNSGRPCRSFSIGSSFHWYLR